MGREGKGGYKRRREMRRGEGRREVADDVNHESKL